MNFIKNILGRIMALWAVIVFIGFMLVFVIPIGICNLWPDPKRSKIGYTFYTAWLAFFFILTGVKRKIKGRENFKKGQNYVVVCNHRSLLDPPLSSPALPRGNKTIAKIEMSRIPIFNIIYKSGSVLVDRKNEESRRKSYLQMREVLAMGLHMCIYPEGTRNKTTQPLQRFHDGAFRLAVDAGKPIIPSLIFDTDKVIPRKTFYYWPHKVEMHFLPQIEVSGKTVRQVKEEAFEVMSAYYTANKKR